MVSLIFFIHQPTDQVYWLVSPEALELMTYGSPDYDLSVQCFSLAPAFAASGRARSIQNMPQWKHRHENRKIIINKILESSSSSKQFFQLYYSEKINNFDRIFTNCQNFCVWWNVRCERIFADFSRSITSTRSEDDLLILSLILGIVDFVKSACCGEIVVSVLSTWGHRTVRRCIVAVILLIVHVLRRDFPAFCQHPAAKMGKYLVLYL